MTSPAPSVFASRRPERLVITFHGLGPAAAGVDAAEAPYWCDEARFTSILDNVGPLSKATGLPIEVTFDDGNASDARIALPALAARGLKAAFFVCAGRIGQAGYLDGADLRELQAAGMTIGSHGWHHLDWRRTDDRTLERETRGALDRIAAEIGQPVDAVGIPFGSYDRRVLKQLRRSGVRTAFTSDGGRAPLDGWLVPRHSYTRAWTDSTLHDVATRPDALMARARTALVRALKQRR